MRPGYTTIQDYIKRLPEERRRLARLQRWKLQRLRRTYGWKAQRYKDEQWCRRAGGCSRTLDLRRSNRAARTTLR